MAEPAARKTFKVLFDLSVEMNDLQDQNLHPPLDAHAASFLSHLQQALLQDEAALLAVMRYAMAGKLQEYIDYMAAQDDQLTLLLVAQRLTGKDAKFLRLRRDEFPMLTRPLHASSLSVDLEQVSIEEKFAPVPGKAAWREVWRDLLRTHPLGRLLKGLSFPDGRLHTPEQPYTSHYLLLMYMTQEVDGVHAQGCCTCDRPFEAIGEDESQALAQLWDLFQAHFRKYQPCA